MSETVDSSEIFLGLRQEASERIWHGMMPGNLVVTVLEIAELPDADKCRLVEEFYRLGNEYALAEAGKARGAKNKQLAKEWEELGEARVGVTLALFLKKLTVEQLRTKLTEFNQVKEGWTDDQRKDRSFLRREETKVLRELVPADSLPRLQKTVAKKGLGFLQRIVKDSL